MYAGKNTALALKQSGSYDDDEGPPAPTPRAGFRGFPEQDYWNRDLSLYLDVPPGLETGTSQPNIEYAPLFNGFAGYVRRVAARAGFGDATGAAVGTAILGPGVGTAVGSIVPIGGLFHTSAAGPNAAAANAVAAEVARGNLAAVAAVITRSGIQTQSSAVYWKNLLATIPQSLINAANAKFPGNNWTTFGAIDPSQVLGVVQRLAVYAPVGTGTTTITAGSGGVPGSPNQVIPGVTQAGLLGSLASSPLTLGAAAVALLLVFKASKGKGYRRVARRRR